jgi:hypothetical protein
MRILLLGRGPGFAWARGVVEAALAAAPASKGGDAKEVDAKRAADTEAASSPPQLVSVEGPPTPAILSHLIAEPIAAVILADHAPFASGPVPASYTPIEAVRGEAQWALMALEVVRRAPRTLILEQAEAEDWPEAIAALLRELLPAAAELPAELAAEVLLAQDALEMPPLAAPGPVLLSTYLRPLYAAAAASAAQDKSLSLVWPREAFLDGDAPGAILPKTVEVAGRARILAYGPYLPLPLGRWRATAWLGFSADIDRISFIFEADAGGGVARGFFEVERGGIFTLQLDFEVREALHPIELRLISQDSALEGQAALIEVEMVPSAAIPG